MLYVHFFSGLNTRDETILARSDNTFLPWILVCLKTCKYTLFIYLFIEVNNGHFIVFLFVLFFIGNMNGQNMEPVLRKQSLWTVNINTSARLLSCTSSSTLLSKFLFFSGCCGFQYIRKLWDGYKAIDERIINANSFVTLRHYVTLQLKSKTDISDSKFRLKPHSELL